MEGTIECIAADISENIRNRTVVDHILLVTPNEPLVKYVEIVDGLSGKKRELGIEKLIFQLYETIIRDATKEMFEAKLENKIDRMNGSIGDLKKSSSEGMAYTWRYRILRFDDEIRHDEKHTKEHFDQIMDDITKYELYCASHPDFPNNKAVFAMSSYLRGGVTNSTLYSSVFADPTFIFGVMELSLMTFHCLL